MYCYQYNKGFKTLLLLFTVILSVTISGFVRAKPGAPVMLQSPSQYTLQANSEATVELVFSLPKRRGELEIQIKTDDAIRLVNTPSINRYSLDGIKTKLTLPLQLQTSGEGKYYVLFQLIFSDEHGKRQARAQGIALQVGEPVIAPKNQKPTQQSTIKTLPAVENIRH